MESGTFERLWAPWRLGYVLGAKEPGCFLCRAGSDDSERENLVLHKDETTVVLLNRYPYNNGHILVSPVRHVGDLLELTAAEQTSLWAHVHQSVRVLQEAMGPQGFNVGANLGKAAGAGVPDHLHVHVMPRWAGDTNFVSTCSDMRTVLQSLEEAWELLAPRFQKG